MNEIETMGGEEKKKSLKKRMHLDARRDALCSRSTKICDGTAGAVLSAAKAAGSAELELRTKAKTKSGREFVSINPAHKR